MKTYLKDFKVQRNHWMIITGITFGVVGILVQGYMSNTCGLIVAIILWIISVTLLLCGVACGKYFGADANKEQILISDSLEFILKDRDGDIKDYNNCK